MPASKMSVLIVDDDDEKISSVKSELSSNAVILDCDVEILTAGALSDAVGIINQRRVDFIVLDLLLPYITDQKPDYQAGQEALRQIRKPFCINRHTPIIGLSAFPNETKSVRAVFESLGVIIHEYRNSSNDWKDALRFHQTMAANKIHTKIPVDFIIFTALEKEKKGYASTNIIFGEKIVVGGLNIQKVSFTQGKIFNGIIIKLRDMGLMAATFEATTALRLFDTKLICISGICAGFSEKVQLGQTVIGSPVWEYQAGKWSSNSFEISPKQVSLPAATRVIIEQAVDESDWWTDVEVGLPEKCARPAKKHRPKILPSASGSAVIADASRLDHIKIQHRKVAAIEMESFGIYYAAYESDENINHYFSAKTVVDFADEGKDDSLHEYGCIISARTTIHLIYKILS